MGGGVKRESGGTPYRVKREPAGEPDQRTSKRTKKEAAAAADVKLEVKAEVKAEVMAEGKSELTALERKQALKANPFPNHAHPTEEECRTVHSALSALHPEILPQKKAKAEANEGGCGDRRLVLDALVGTILSQNTTDTNSHRAFCALKTKFPSWEQVLVAPPAEVEDAIRSGGLAATKTARMQSILQTLQAERGELSMEYMRALGDEEVKAELRRFKGVGAKTISCVLMFCLQRADFPVDTHVWKIAMALGWVPKTADRDQTYEHLNRRVPAEIKYALHVLLVEHGKIYKNDIKALRKACAQPIVD